MICDYANRIVKSVMLLTNSTIFDYILFFKYLLVYHLFFSAIVYQYSNYGKGFS